MDLSQVVPYVLAHAQWIGPGLLTVGLIVRILGRTISRALLAAGVLATLAVAYGQWQIAHSLLWAGGILVAGLVVFGLLAWTIRGLSFLFAFGLFAAAWYLILYGWAGPSFVATTTGSLAWAGAAILSMVVSGLGGRVHRGHVLAAGVSAAP